MIELANRHPRVNILKPGPGVGGHCIAVDPWFIVDAAPQEARLIRTAREVNDRKVDYVISRAAELIEAYPDRPIACLGLAFKANVDDLRESPALAVAPAACRNLWRPDRRRRALPEEAARRTSPKRARARSISSRRCPSPAS